ncbi:unnamed protein product [Cochlearia groenlandica]
MDRVKSYVFDFSGDDFDQSPSDSSSSSPSSSSSIGKNSDGEEDAGENEAESLYKGPLDMIQSLEQVLPFRKGISKFYNGKSKSFTNLTEEVTSSSTSSSSSVKDLAKPENPYSRRRRNLLSHKISPRGGISKKRVLNSSRSVLTLAITGDGSSLDGDSSPESSLTVSESPPSRRKSVLPPLYPRSKGYFGNLKSSRLCAFDSVNGFPRCFPATASGVGYKES